MSRNSSRTASGSVARAVGVVWREERDRLVSPVVHAPLRRVLRVELKHRQQLDGGDAQVLQVRNLLDQSGVRPPLQGRHPGAGMPGEAADVKLVDDRLGAGPPDRRIAFPVVAGEIRHDALHRGGRVVAGPFRGVPVVGAGHRHGAAVRVEEDLPAVEPEPALWRERAVGTVGVDLSRPEIRHEDVPVVIGAMGSWIEQRSRVSASSLQRRRTTGARSTRRSSHRR